MADTLFLRFISTVFPLATFLNPSHLFILINPRLRILLVCLDNQRGSSLLYTENPLKYNLSSSCIVTNIASNINTILFVCLFVCSLILLFNLVILIILFCWFFVCLLEQVRSLCLTGSIDKMRLSFLSLSLSLSLTHPLKKRGNRHV